MWIQRFIDYLKYERNYSQRTTEAYEADLKAFERYYETLDSELSWNTIDEDIVRQWMVQMMEAGNSATSVNRRLSALRSFYRFLLRGRLVEHDPVHSLTGPKKQRTLPAYLRETDMNRLLDGDIPVPPTYAGARDRMMLLTFYSTGIRLSELVGMNTADADLSLRQLKVTGKRNKQRIIPLGNEMLQAVRDYLEQRSRFASQHAADPDAFFLNERTGQRIAGPKVETIVKHYLSMVTTQKKRSPHVLRHTFATTMLNNQADLQSVKELLGHESLSTTEIYTHTSFEELRQLYNQAHPRATEKGGNHGH